MYMTDRMKEALPKIAAWLATVPSGIPVTIDQGSGNQPEVRMQSHDQDSVARVRSLLPGLIWKKSYNKKLAWWEYNAHCSSLDCDIEIYGVTEAPPTCRVERRTIEVEEEVPVTFEKRMVTKEVVEVVCGDGNFQENERP